MEVLDLESHNKPCPVSLNWSSESPPPVTWSCVTFGRCSASPLLKGLALKPHF